MAAFGVRHARGPNTRCASTRTRPRGSRATTPRAGSSAPTRWDFGHVLAHPFYTTVHPFYTRLTARICTCDSETTMRCPVACSLRTAARSVHTRLTANIGACCSEKTLRPNPITAPVVLKRQCVVRAQPPGRDAHRRAAWPHLLRLGNTVESTPNACLVPLTGLERQVSSINNNQQQSTTTTNNTHAGACLERQVSTINICKPSRHAPTAGRRDPQGDRGAARPPRGARRRGRQGASAAPCVVAL